jgi:octaprenyl-diphosphate synthase
MNLEPVKLLINQYVKECDNSEVERLFTLLSEGKMLRSKLILNIAGHCEDAIKLCAVVEMIQSASLLHDDVIDEADTRRGKPTINKLFDNKTSIMLGDILYSKAFTVLTSLPQDIAYTISQSVTKLSIGELIDIKLTDSFNKDKDLYRDMIYKKTASLIEASAKAAALLSCKDADKFALYGKNLGLAFQMVDDILDVTSDSKTLGKPAMLDFIEGKVTLPYLFLYENSSNKTKIESLFKKELTEEEIDWLKSEFTKTKAIEQALQEAQELGKEALESISEYKNSSLEGIITAMIDREF